MDNRIKLAILALVMSATGMDAQSAMSELTAAYKAAIADIKMDAYENVG